MKNVVKVKRREKINDVKLLDGICAAIYMTNYRSSKPNRAVISDLRDRESVTDGGYPLYKGRFFNALIALRNARTTNRIYLYDEDGFKPLRDGISTYGDISILTMEENAKTIIELEE